MERVERVVLMVVVVVKHGPNINTLILQNMEHESTCYCKVHYNEVQEEAMAAGKVEEKDHYNSHPHSIYFLWYLNSATM